MDADGVDTNDTAPAPRLHTGQHGLAAEELHPQIPLRRLGTAEDTANVALFLGSDLGSFVTGLYIPVCGGQVME